MQLVLTSWEIFAAVGFLVTVGFSLGLWVKVIIKTSVTSYFNEEMNKLNQLVEKQVKETQVQCDALVQQAQTKAISIYQDAAQKAADNESGEDDGLSLN